MRGEALPDNARMLNLAQHFGFRLDPPRDGVVAMSLTLQDHRTGDRIR
jgi:hypothetical protein